MSSNFFFAKSLIRKCREGLALIAAPLLDIALSLLNAYALLTDAHGNGVTVRRITSISFTFPPKPNSVQSALVLE